MTAGRFWAILAEMARRIPNSLTMIVCGLLFAFLAAAPAAALEAQNFASLLSSARKAESPDAKMELYSRAIAAWTSGDSGGELAAAYRDRSWLHYEKRDWTKAVEDASSSLLWDPRNWLGYHFRGWARYQLGEYALAADDHRISAELNFGDPYLRFGEAISWNLAGRPADAAVAARRALERDSTYVFAWTELGMAAFEEQRYEDATRHFQKSLEVGGAKSRVDAGALVGLALVLWQKGAWDEALFYIDDVFEFAEDPDAIDIWMNAVRRYTAKQNELLDEMFEEY